MKPNRVRMPLPGWPRTGIARASSPSAAAPNTLLFLVVPALTLLRALLILRVARPTRVALAAVRAADPRAPPSPGAPPGSPCSARL